MADENTKKIQDCTCEELELRLEELTEKYKRARADYQNLEKRVNGEKEAVIKFANEVLVKRLLPVLDGLEEVQAACSEEGLEIVLNQLNTILSEAGVEEIGIKGQEFDPEKAEAVEVVEGSQDKVVEVVRKGYTLNGKVIRPARVKVGKEKIK